MWRCLPCFLAASLLLFGCRREPAGDLPDIPGLEKVLVYALDVPEPMEPSGLVFQNGLLLTVADKIDDTIFRVAFDGDAARLVPHLTFTPPESGPMDWEGLTTDPEGNLYLISERRGRLLRVTPAGEAAWVTPDLREPAAKEGLFAKFNAGFEGVTRLGPGHWLGAVEREPRGLVEWRIDTGPLENPEGAAHLLEYAGQQLYLEAFDKRDSAYIKALPLLRLPDYSGLDSVGDRVYALFRNAHLVVELARTPDGWQEIDAWTYRHIETNPQWAYRAQTYGQAEGLAIRGRDVFLIFDNNKGGRQRDPDDRRPMLVHARFTD